MDADAILLEPAILGFDCQLERVARSGRPRSASMRLTSRYSAVRAFLNELDGFEQSLSDIRLSRPGGLRQAIQLMGPEFQISDGGRNVKVRPTARLRGKQ